MPPKNHCCVILFLIKIALISYIFGDQSLVLRHTQVSYHVGQIRIRGGSINGGLPKWMVYNGQSHLEMDDLRKPPYYHSIYIYICISCQISQRTPIISPSGRNMSSLLPFVKPRETQVVRPFTASAKQDKIRLTLYKLYLLSETG